ncbi:MAG: hypothetical protein KF683_09880 [Rubrivivax sp.]|nr:hypothetical protein [Rubrivivax sp.]
MYRLGPERTGPSPADLCAPPSLIVPAPSQRANVQCPPGMNLVISGDDGIRGLCRSGSIRRS